MDNYLIDQQILEQFVDELMRKKPLPLASTEQIKNFREELIGSLDKEIGLAIFSKLDDAQLAEFNQLLDSNDSPETFKKFFGDSSVDLQETISETLTTFGKRFLGEENG